NSGAATGTFTTIGSLNNSSNYKPTPTYNAHSLDVTFDLPLSDTSTTQTLNATEGASTGDQVVATFTDADSASAASLYTATIHWSDGTTSSGTVQVHAGGGFEVHGSHTYGEENTTGYAITVDVADSGGSNLTGISKTTITVA